MEVCSALRVPDSTPLLATKIRIFTFALVFIPNSVANSTAIGIRLVAESAIITEAIGAVLPAYGAYTVESSPAVRVAKSSILFLTLSARGNDLTDTTAIGILPTV